MPQFTGSIVIFPARVSLVAYTFTILAGSLVLLLPAARAPDAAPISLLDSLFTATSACCVTGLTVRSTLHDFSMMGQGVILLLMQLGGLGIMTITTLMAFQVAGQATLHQRAVIAETVGVKAGRDLRWVPLAVLGTVLTAEAIGFGFICAATWNSGDPSTVIWHALFHSVSAFCNAGFSLGDDSLMTYSSNVPMLGVICSLIVVGGIGFPVIFDIIARLQYHRDFWLRLHLQSKLMLLGTAVLLFLGAGSFVVLEWENVLDQESITAKFLTSIFHATTCRTAGFHTVDYASLTNATLFLTIILMSIGAGPCSTGGGFKVSTMMTLAVRAWATVRGQREANFGGRTIPDVAVKRATATALLFATVAITALLSLLIVEANSSLSTRPRWFLDALFECISALGTVGLSTGITASLSEPGKLVIMALMIIGRLGPIGAAAALSREQTTYQLAYPEEEPLIG
ncbi:MAG: potassium transporter TrkG [Pirellulales bacterium]